MSFWYQTKVSQRGNPFSEGMTMADYYKAMKRRESQ